MECLSSRQLTCSGSATASSGVLLLLMSKFDLIFRSDRMDSCINLLRLEGLSLADEGEHGDDRVPNSSRTGPSF